jgi:magnesium-transporting ATPase (P-type)
VHADQHLLTLAEFFMSLLILIPCALQVILRNLPVIEGLGSITSICTDKTGTLTEGKMKTEELFCAGKLYAFSGSVCPQFLFDSAPLVVAVTNSLIGCGRSNLPGGRSRTYASHRRGNTATCVRSPHLSPCCRTCALLCKCARCATTAPFDKMKASGYKRAIRRKWRCWARP